jgi:hypothetical protein
MNIKEKFLELTSRTYPHGTEEELFPILFNTVDGLEKDEFGNLFIKIGDSDVMFTSHLDTATSANTTVNHVFDGDIIKTDGKSILGADDKAGVTIMLYMIKNQIPGLYYFFLGEEVGCVGSRKVANVQKENKIEGINKVISFDRRGTNSVITFQSGKRCTSDNFGKTLASQLNQADADFKYETDPTGVLTDSIQFISIYPECTNISVGYQSEHTFSETQNIAHLEKLAEACLKVDWKSLPVERDPSVVEYKTYGSGWGYPGWDDDDYYYGSRYGSRQGGYSTYNNWGNITKPKTKTENVWFHDNKYNYVSKVEIEEYTKKVVSVDLCKGRIAEEKLVIDALIKALDVDYKSSEWDGFKYKLNYESNYSTECNRNDLIEYLPELDYSKVEELGSLTNDMFDTDAYLDMCDGFYD